MSDLDLDALEQRNNDPLSKTVISRHDLSTLIQRLRDKQQAEIFWSEKYLEVEQRLWEAEAGKEILWDEQARLQFRIAQLEQVLVRIAQGGTEFELVQLAIGALAAMEEK